MNDRLLSMFGRVLLLGLMPWMAGQNAPPPASATAAGAAALAQRRTPVVEVFQSCKDAVVNISSTQVIRVESPRGTDGLFDEFFDMPRPRREYKATSVGSGFVLHSAGYIVTNAHVVARTAERKVIFADQKEYDAQIVAIDSRRDLAILKIEADRPLPVIRLGRSADLMVGETAIAIGNPLGYGHTVTAGVVSAVNRSMEIDQNQGFTGLIQTDTSINPGSSGGPLFNVLGELIGINTAIRSDAQNIGFAIPVDQLRDVLPELLDVERRYRISVGVQVQREGAAQVSQITSESPADSAGLKSGDVITSLGGQIVRSGIDFHIALIGCKPGQALSVELLRQGKAMRLTLTPQARPKPDAAKLLWTRLGLEAQPLSATAARGMNLPALRGLVVEKVERGGPSDRIGLRAGDIIDHLAGQQAANLDDLGELLEKLESGRPIPLSVLRISGRTLYRAQVAMAAR